MLKSIFAKTWIILFLIVTCAFISRIWRISLPSGYYFDEVYHGATSKLVAQGDERAYEWWNPPPEPDTAVDWLHPPFAKLTQATSMKIFGENSLGWRMSSVVFGTASVLLVFFLAKEIGFSRYTSLLATVLYAFSGLALTMSRIAMNDIHVTFFIMLSVWLYWRWRKHTTTTNAILVGLSSGLAASSKWSGVFVVGLYILDHALIFLRNYLEQRKTKIRPFLVFWLSLLWLIPGMYFLSYGQMFYQGKDLQHWWELHKQIWWYQTNLDATHPYQSTPWEWILSLRPVYAYTKSTSAELVDIYLQENFILAWLGFLAVIWSALDIFTYLLQTARYIWQSAMTQQKKWHKLLLEHWKKTPENYRLLFTLAAYAIFWLPWVFSPRIMFFYHYLPSIPFLVILLANQLEFVHKKMRRGPWIVFSILLMITTTFVLFYPHWTGIPVPREPWSQLYFMFDVWR